MEVDAVKLRELREDRTLSVRELAELAGVHYHTIVRLENEQSGAHPRTIRKLAEALGVEPRELRR
jgi:transcriptional regulator with XRE-family HTH domain